MLLHRQHWSGRREGSGIREIGEVRQPGGTSFWVRIDGPQQLVETQLQFGHHSGRGKNGLLLLLCIVEREKTFVQRHFKFANVVVGRAR